MVVRLLSKLFGVSTKEEPKPQQDTKRPPVDGADPVGLVEFLIRGLAGETDQVRIETEGDDRNLLIRVHCGKSDMGRVIGKNGKTIGAIRHLATDAAARNKIRIRKIEIVEP